MGLRRRGCYEGWAGQTAEYKLEAAANRSFGGKGNTTLLRDGSMI